MKLHVTNWTKQKKISKYFYVNEGHVQIGLMMISKINTNISQGNESYSQDKK